MGWKEYEQTEQDDWEQRRKSKKKKKIGHTETLLPDIHGNKGISVPKKNWTSKGDSSQNPTVRIHWDQAVTTEWDGRSREFQTCDDAEKAERWTVELSEVAALWQGKTRDWREKEQPEEGMQEASLKFY